MAVVLIALAVLVVLCLIAHAAVRAVGRFTVETFLGEDLFTAVSRHAYAKGFGQKRTFVEAK